MVFNVLLLDRFWRGVVGVSIAIFRKVAVSLFFVNAGFELFLINYLAVHSYAANCFRDCNDL